MKSEQTVDVSTHPLARRLLADQLPGTSVDLTIHRDDEMLTDVLKKHDWDFAVASYVQIGLEAFRSHKKLIDLFFPDGFDDDVLEFAAGFGRVTRFLAAYHGSQKVLAAEIQEPAVRYLAEQFGVCAIRSTYRSLDVPAGRRLAIVIAHSFFSHLPERSFRDWLARLYEIVMPGGILIFSVHDESLIDAAERDPSGITFRAVSESDRLAPEEYGSAWVSEKFVSRVVRESCPGGVMYRWPRGLANFQDLYVVSGKQIAHEALAQLDQGPFGFLGIKAGQGSRMDVVGWASHWNPNRSVAAVVVSINGRPIKLTTSFAARPDAVEHTGDRRHLVSGWRCRFRVPEDCEPDTDVLTVTARSDAGAETVLYIGTMAQALASAGQESTSDDADDAGERVFGLWSGIQTGETTRKEAEAMAEKIFAVEPDSPHGHRLLALVAFSRGDIPSGIRRLRATLARAEDAENLAWLCVAYSLAGCTDLARPLAKRLTAIKHRSLMAFAGMIIVSWTDGEFEETLRLARAARMSGEINSTAYVELLMLLFLGRDAREEPPQSEPESYFARLAMLVQHASRGERAEALNVLEAIEESSRFDPQYAIEVAGAMALLGETAAAIDWVATAMHRGFLNHAYVERNPFFRNLRGTPRFEVVVKEMERRSRAFRAAL